MSTFSTTSDDSSDLYAYEPSTVAAIVFVGAFAIVLIVKLLDYFKFRQRKATKFPFPPHTADNHEDVIKQSRKQISVCLIPICLGFFFQSLGYALRILSISGENRSNLTLYIIPTFFTLVSPSLMSAGIFMVHTRIEKFTHTEKFSIMPNRFLTVFFVTGDIVSFLLQAGGGAIMVRDGMRQVGLSVGLVGFGLQIFFFAFFIFVASVWHWRMENRSTPVGRLMKANALGVKYNNWKLISLGMIASMALILVRCALRIAEFAELATDSTFFSHSELAYYMIDPFVVFWSSVLLVIIRPEYRLWDLKTYQVWLESKGEEPSRVSVELEEVGFNIEGTIWDPSRYLQEDYSGLNWKRRELL